MKENSSSVTSFQNVDASNAKDNEYSFESFPDVDWENTSQLNFAFNEFEHGIQDDSPVKTGYERDWDYEPESDVYHLLK